jgi:hypothetical protein
MHKLYFVCDTQKMHGFVFDEDTVLNQQFDAPP